MKAFKMKLRLFRSQLLKGEMTHFPICTKHIAQCQHFEIREKFAQQIEILMQEFDGRLTLSQDIGVARGDQRCHGPPEF